MQNVVIPAKDFNTLVALAALGAASTTKHDPNRQHAIAELKRIIVQAKDKAKRG